MCFRLPRSTHSIIDCRESRGIVGRSLCILLFLAILAQAWFLRMDRPAMGLPNLSCEVMWGTLVSGRMSVLLTCHHREGRSRRLDGTPALWCLCASLKAYASNTIPAAWAAYGSASPRRSADGSGATQPVRWRFWLLPACHAALLSSQRPHTYSILSSWSAAKGSDASRCSGAWRGGRTHRRAQYLSHSSLKARTVPTGGADSRTLLYDVACALGPDSNDPLQACRFCDLPDSDRQLHYSTCGSVPMAE